MPGRPPGLRLRRAPSSGGYIAGAWYHSIFFLFPPLIALVLGVGLSFTVLGEAKVYFMRWDHEFVVWFLEPFIMAHLVAVVYRSRLNGAVFRRFPLRFTVVPLAFFLAMGFPTTALVTVSVAATFWDVCHSGMHTFGLGRVYDARADNDPRLGRRLDAVFNLLIYVRPIAAGVMLMDHVGNFKKIRSRRRRFFHPHSGPGERCGGRADVGGDSFRRTVCCVLALVVLAGVAGGLAR